MSQRGETNFDMAINKSINNITVEDLQALVENRTAEGKTIEFKKTLPSNNYEGKKEFLADVSSFANSSGGFLFYGIREENGTAVELCGLQNINADAEIQRLENLLRDNIKQRIPGVLIRNVPLPSGDSIIIIYIPRSWAQPHVVDFEKHWRFYSRNSVGKYPLDVSELKTAFNLSATSAERIRLFRTERLGKVVAGETPIFLSEKARTVLHLVPLSSLDVAAEVFDVAELANDTGRLAPIYASGGWNHRHNFDGFLTYKPDPQGINARSYLQVFRNGIVEAVDAGLLRYQGDRALIPSHAFEEALIKALAQYLRVQKDLGVSTPLFMMLSLTGISGYTMTVNKSWYWDEAHPIDRDTLVIPEIMIEDFDCNPAKVMKPAFDAVWNASGWPRSMNYDQGGKWLGKY